MNLSQFYFKTQTRSRSILSSVSMPDKVEPNLLKGTKSSISDLKFTIRRGFELPAICLHRVRRSLFVFSKYFSHQLT